MEQSWKDYIEGKCEKPGVVITDVIHCARCRKNHKELLFKEFEYPIVDNDGKQWEWYAFCPANEEPILLLGKSLDTTVYHDVLSVLQLGIDYVNTFGDRSGMELSSGFLSAITKIERFIG